MLNHYTLEKWQTKANEIPQHKATITENLKIAKSIADKWSIEIFERQLKEHTNNAEAFKRERGIYDDLSETFANAEREREAANALVTAGSLEPEVALRNHAALIVADAKLNAVAQQLALQEAKVTGCAVAIRKMDHGADLLVSNENRRHRYLPTLFNPGEHFNLKGGGSMTIPFGESPLPYLKQLAFEDGQGLSSGDALWLNFAQELCRLEFNKMLKDRKREMREFEQGGNNYRANKVLPFVPTPSDLEHIFASRREGYAAATRAKQNQIDALKAELSKQV